jgi:hypothetical protein
MGAMASQTSVSRTDAASNDRGRELAPRWKFACAAFGLSGSSATYKARPMDRRHTVVAASIGAIGDLPLAEQSPMRGVSDGALRLCIKVRIGARCRPSLTANVGERGPVMSSMTTFAAGLEVGSYALQ